jgi:hypothetical protein
MDYLGVYRQEIDLLDPGWSTPLGRQIFAYVLKQALLTWVVTF